jgi:hypothetical protein
MMDYDAKSSVLGKQIVQLLDLLDEVVMRQQS